MKSTELFIQTFVFIFMLTRGLCSVSPPPAQNEFCNCSMKTSVNNQSQLDKFMANISSYSSDNASDDVCVRLSLVGSIFKLDVLQLMKINLGTNGSLVITGNSVNINCTTNVTDPEELRELLQPISRALLVLFDGLVFTGCPVPIVMEEVSNVMIQNCVFL